MITYVAPNRSHHFIFAEALAKAGLLAKFVSGYPRVSGKFQTKVPTDKIAHWDHLQTLFVVGLRWQLPVWVTDVLDDTSKRWLGMGGAANLKEASCLFFYNGTGGRGLRKAHRLGLRTVCEVVNSHTAEQDRILREEARKLKVEFPRPFGPEFKRRQQEYQDSDYIIGPSDFVLESFRSRGFPGEKLRKVPYGCNPVYRRAAPKEWTGKGNRPLTVLYVGSVHFRKGLRYLIKAIAGIPESSVSVRIVGPKSNPSGIDDLSIPENVTFVGTKSGSELEREYEHADLFVQPSLEEGLSLVIGEALAAGLPVIATCSTGASELFSHGHGGWIVKSGDSDTLQEAIERFVGERYFLQEQARQAWQVAQDNNGWERCQQDLVSVFQEILS